MITRDRKSQSGFALIAVLFSLVILVLLFGSAQKNFVAHATFLGAQYHREDRNLVDKDLIAIIQLHSVSPDIISVEFDGETLLVSFQDVGGLVDLNTASPDLMNLLLTNIGIENVSDILLTYRNWRRQGYQLQRISDFARVTGLPFTVTDQLAHLSTVKSGRKGIDVATAPVALLEILTGETGQREYLAERIPEAFRSPASNVNYLVSIKNLDGQIDSSITVHIPANQNGFHILEF